TDNLSNWSTTSESEKRPPKDIRWSVATEPAISSDMSRNTTVRYWFHYQSVTPSVPVMIYFPSSHLTHAELSPTPELVADARQVVSSLRLERAVMAAVEPAPSIHFEDYPREMVKPEI